MKGKILGEKLCFLTAAVLLIICTSLQGMLDTKETVREVNAGEAVSLPMAEEQPQVAITFDDGPTIYTGKLLEGLKERGVKASFFLLGQNIEGREDVVKEMYREGHLIGNHTYSHVQLSKLPRQKAKEEIEKTSELIFDITGQYTAFVRPPYGEWRKELEYEVAMFPVFWSVDPLDWKTNNPDAVVQRVEKEVEEGDIILLHDGSESSVEAALRIVDDLIKKGYRFVTVDEMLLE